MTGRRQAIEVAISEEDLAALRAIARSRTELASWVERARMLLAYRDDPSFFAVGRAVGAHHQTVQRCVERALAYGPMAARHPLSFCSEVIPVAGIKLGIGRRLCVASDAEQRTEGVERVEAPVEPKREFVEVGL